MSQEAFEASQPIFDEERIEEMRGVIIDAVEQQDPPDFEFVWQIAKIADEQRFFSLAEIAELMDQQRRNEDKDLETRIKWALAIEDLRDKIDEEGKDLPVPDQATFDAILIGMRKIGRPALELVPGPPDPDEKNDLQSPKFEGLVQKEFDRIWNLPAFEPVKKRILDGPRSIEDLKTLVDMTEKIETEREEKDKMRQVVDGFVYIKAAKCVSREDGDIFDLPLAKSVIETYGSSEAAKAKMSAALEPYIIKEAQRLMQRDKQRAANLIRYYLDPARSEDALRQLNTEFDTE